MFFIVASRFSFFDELAATLSYSDFEILSL